MVPEPTHIDLFARSLRPLILLSFLTINPWPSWKTTGAKVNPFPPEESLLRVKVVFLDKRSISPVLIAVNLSAAVRGLY